MRSGKYLIWDFDGTLAYRNGMWSGALWEIIQENLPGHQCSLEDLRPSLANGFPWHDCERTHCHIRSSDEWWDLLDPLFANSFRSVGIDDELALILAKRVRNQYPHSSYWHLFDDSIEALAELSDRGWTHLILSNHVPELPCLVEFLGLGEQISAIFNSALTGYEKPHPRAWDPVLERVESGAAFWMIGDNPIADIAGAERLGIPSILVRRQHASRHRCDDLRGVRAIIDS